MIMLLALAAATPILPTPAQSQDIRCVAMLGIAANDQKRMAGDRSQPPLKDRGADFAALVGEDVMATTGRTREQVRDLIVAEVLALRKRPASASETTACIAWMEQRTPLPPPASAPR